MTIEILPTPRKVTQEEFDKLTCNRCGQCCEKLYQPSPLALAKFLGEIEPIFHWSKEELVEVGWDSDKIDDYFKMWNWISHLEPTGYEFESSMYGHRVEYTCTYLIKIDGQYTCTNYENRPNICKNFPYGESVLSIPECSWFVYIGDEDV